MKKPPAALKVVGPLKDKLELVKDTPLVLYEGNNDMNGSKVANSIYE